MGVQEWKTFVETEAPLGGLTISPYVMIYVSVIPLKALAED